MKNKRGFSVGFGMIVSIILILIMTLLIIFGLYNNTLQPLLNKVGGMANDVLVMLHIKAAPVSSNYLGYDVTIVGVGDGRMFLRNNECKVEMKNGVGSYALDVSDNRLKQYLGVYTLNVAEETSGHSNPTTTKVSSFVYFSYNYIINKWQWMNPKLAGLNQYAWGTVPYESVNGVDVGSDDPRKIIQALAQVQSKYNDAAMVKSEGEKIFVDRKDVSYTNTFLDIEDRIANDEMIKNKEIQDGLNNIRGGLNLDLSSLGLDSCDSKIIMASSGFDIVCHKLKYTSSGADKEGDITFEYNPESGMSYKIANEKIGWNSFSFISFVSLGSLDVSPSSDKPFSKLLDSISFQMREYLSSLKLNDNSVSLGISAKCSNPYSDVNVLLQIVPGSGVYYGVDSLGRFYRQSQCNDNSQQIEIKELWAQDTYLNAGPDFWKQISDNKKIKDFLINECK